MKWKPVEILCRRLVSTVPVEQCVPPHISVSSSVLLKVENFLLNSERLFVLTGAGVSTESGIKDYRSEKVGLYATSTSRPTNYSEFLKSTSVRQRYWARNTTAWPIFSSFRPNVSHQFLATLEYCEKLHWLVTQNVDSLHYKAGSRRLTELHGTVSSVICLDCHRMLPRDEIQEKILMENPHWSAQPGGFAPDADVYVSQAEVERFRAPLCDHCGGILKPDVVFFGDVVPRKRVEHINQMLEESDACVVLGSSVETYSSFRHIRRCKELGIPLMVLNIGPTRVDSLADLKVVGRCGEIFKKLMDRNKL